MPIKFLLSALICLPLVITASQSWGKQRLSESNTESVAACASREAKANGANYKTRNYFNPVIHNIFMANNRAETGQMRVGLANLSKTLAGKIALIDMIGDKPADWCNLNDAQRTKLRNIHSIAAIRTENLNDPNAKVIVIFSSASHNLMSTLLLNVFDDLTSKGFIVVGMEYPGYGGSLGEPGKANWYEAGVGLLRYLNSKLERKPVLLGHSIGSAVAMELASMNPYLVSGVVSHAGFYSLTEASKDSTDVWPIINETVVPIMARIMGMSHNWNNANTLPLLAKNSTPILFIQGEFDRSVRPEHLRMFQGHASALQQQYPKFQYAIESIQGASHEDIFVDSSYGPYDEIWTKVLQFIGRIP
jgi:pimeloyl-ACP methyl ester carboxylesterase